MRLTTLVKYSDLLTDIFNSGLTLTEYCTKNNISAQTIYNVIGDIKKNTEERSDLKNTILDLYHKITGPKEIVDSDDFCEIAYERDSDDKIKYYTYRIYKRNKSPLVGKLSREEMAVIYRLYSYYGDSLTRRAISRHFPDLSLTDFKRILKAFNIYKDSSPFPPHYIEEYSIEELREIQLREKENSFLRKAEEDNIKNTEKLLKKYAAENIELRKQKEKEFIVNFPENINPISIPEFKEVGQNMTLYIADMHLGSYCTSGSLYKENTEYGYEEAKRRLSEVLFKLRDFDCLDTLNIVLMGDNIDCPGFFGKTARMDHDMPENMDPREQANSFFELMMWFISSIANADRDFVSKIRVYSVPCGNHAGNFEYVCNKALMAMINAKFPNIETTLWEEFYGIFEQSNKLFCCMHGKDSDYMKKGLPKDLNDKTQVLLYEFLEEKNIHNKEIHFVKGDLHSDNLNTCKRFSYRNVLSLYGASDYSNYNFSRNSYGISYDLFIGDNLIRGTFENLLYYALHLHRKRL